MQVNNLSSILLKSRTRVFLSLARTHSFTATAKELGVSQSSVSRAMLDLENELGLALIDHSIRPIRLTSAGVSLRQFLIDERHRIDAHLSELSQGNYRKPPLRIGFVESLARVLGRAVVHRMQNDCSSITVLTGVASYLLRLLDEELLDVIVCSDPFQNRNDLRRRFLFREPSVVLAPKSLALPVPLTWQALQYCGLPLIHYHKNNSGGKLEKKLFAELGVNFVNRIEVDINAMLVSFVADGMGWALTRPSTLVQHSALLDGIRICPSPEPLSGRDVFVINRNAELDDMAANITRIAAGAFLEHFVPEFDRITPWVGDYLFVAADGEGTPKPVRKGLESKIYVL